jgi:hypothetical protein
VPVRAPWAGCDATVYVRLSGGVFESVPVRVIDAAVLNATATVWLFAVGAPPVTFNVTVAVLLTMPDVFVTVNVKLSVPP